MSRRQATFGMWASATMNAQRLGRSTSTKVSMGLRTVAIFEAVKGASVLLLAAGVLNVVHKNLDDVAERLTEVLHVNPEGRLSNLFVQLTSHATEATLWMMALGALVYAAVRSIEAYGLWREREWAQWFALLSSTLYLPPELYWLLHRASWPRGAVLITNVLTLVIMLKLRVKSIGRRHSCGSPGE